MCNFAIYDGFVDILTGILSGINSNVTRFDTVQLTVPDGGFLWNVPELASVEHFMKKYENVINDGCDNILSLITESNEAFVVDMERSFNKVYTYQYYEYVHKMFAFIFNIDLEDSRQQSDVVLKNKRKLYDIILQTIRELYYNKPLTGILNTDGLQEFLGRCSQADAISKKEIDNEIDYVSICSHKIICAVIYTCDNEQVKYNVAPIMLSFSEMFQIEKLNIKNNLDSVTDEKRELELYEELYDLIENCHEEIQNKVTNDFYEQFFGFINRAEIQDNILFQDPQKHEKIFKLYNLFYANIKYKLYRAYGETTVANTGLMRNSLIDRKIVLGYLEGYNRNMLTEYEFEGVGERRFVIRLANEGDKGNLISLSNPTPPYRRAIFIRFNKDELNEAIDKQQLWIIEELYKGERILACSAIILYNDEKRSYKTFYAGEMNDDYCKKHYGSGKNLPPYYRFIDFDSIIVDDGRVNRHGRSYRGCGFQRIMLILAEEIAKSKGCDYICATVSSFNKPSERNFILNGYEVKTNKNYPFKECDPSPFYQFITSSDADEIAKNEFQKDLEYEIVAYRNILNHLGITEEEYRRDMNVPREFVVLNLNQK